MGKLLSIAHNTFLQTIRQPIYLVLILATTALLVLSLPMAGWTMGESGGDYHDTDQKMLVNLGLSSLLVSSLFVAAFSASGALAREIEDRTALTVISKPVSRATFVTGKFAGVAVAVALSYYVCSLVFLMTVRHQVLSAASDPYDMPVLVLGCSAGALALLLALSGNFFFGWPFTSASVWSLLVCLTLAMGLLSFVGKQWKVVPPGYDEPPRAAPDAVRVDLDRAHPPEAFRARAQEAGCTVVKTEGTLQVLRIADASVESMARDADTRYDRHDRLGSAIRAVRTWPGVRGASTVTEPPVIGPDLLAAIALIFMGVLVLVAVAILASTRLGQAMTLLVCVGAFMVGSVHPVLGHWSHLVAVNLLGWAAPNLTYFYSMDALSRPIAATIPLSFIAATGAYCALYVAGLLAVGIALFQRRQMDATSAGASMPGAVSLLAGLGRAAALVTGFAALVLLSVPDYYTAGGLLTIAALMGAAAGSWALWTSFGRGSRWSYWLVVLGSALGAAGAAGGLVLPVVGGGIERLANPVLVVLAGLAALLTLGLCLFPKTRRHFRSHAS